MTSRSMTSSKFRTGIWGFRKGLLSIGRTTQNNQQGTRITTRS